MPHDPMYWQIKMTLYRTGDSPIVNALLQQQKMANRWLY